MKKRLHSTFFASIAVLFFAFSSCDSKEPLIVYSDPWLSDYAHQIELLFEAQHPNSDIQVKELSSELIAQHIHFGQPIDIFLCFGPDLLPEDVKGKIDAEVVLAPSRMVLVSGKADELQTQFKTENCVMVEASDRPSRVFAERGFSRIWKADHCHIVANFNAQAKDYLLRHWIREGIVPEHFQKNNSAKFSVLEEGPLIVNGFSAIKMKNAVHSEAANELFRMISSEESKKILGELGYVP